MKKIWIQKALSLKSLAAQHRLQTAWCMVGLNNPDSQKHTDTEATTCTCACTWHTFQVTQDTPGCVHMQNSVQDMHKIPAHNAFIDHWCPSVHTGAWLFMGCTRKHTNGHASDYPCTPRVQNAVYTHRTCTYMCTLIICPWIFVFWKEKERVMFLGKRKFSQTYVWETYVFPNVCLETYVPGRYQETLAGGFHIALLSLIKTFFVLSFSVGFLILWAKDIRTCTCPPLLLRLAFSWDGLVRFWSSLFWLVSRLMMGVEKRREVLDLDRARRRTPCLGTPCPKM